MLKIRLVLFAIFDQLVVILCFSCSNMSKFYPPDRGEFSKLDNSNFGGKLDSEKIDSLPGTEESTNKDRDVKKQNLKIVSHFYQRNFDDSYAYGPIYSEVFKNTTQRSYLNDEEFINNYDFNNYSYSAFPKLREIYNYIEILERLGNGKAVVSPLKRYEYGYGWRDARTTFGNQVLSIRVSSAKSLKPHVENSIIVVVAGIHGSDWYAIQSAIFLATELILNDNHDEHFEWFIVPILNPDGYEMSHIRSHWRDFEKNLYQVEGAKETGCFGVDLDLHFVHQWLECNETLCDPNYPGELPFLDTEAIALRDTLEAFSDYCDSFIALKEGRQMLVYPFADTLESPRHVDELDGISMRAVKSFGEHVQGFYDYGQSSNLVGLRAGFIEDWAKVHLGIEKSFAFYLGPIAKDRRDLQSQHLMNHMTGTFALLHTIAREKISKKIDRKITQK